jgi:hypothetical protein
MFASAHASPIKTLPKAPAHGARVNFKQARCAPGGRDSR